MEDFETDYCKSDPGEDREPDHLEKNLHSTCIVGNQKTAVNIGYSTKDLFAMTFQFNPNSPKAVEWHVALEVVEASLSGESGVGDVVIKPVAAQDNGKLVELDERGVENAKGHYSAKLYLEMVLDGKSGTSSVLLSYGDVESMVKQALEGAHLVAESDFIEKSLDKTLSGILTA